MIVADTNVWSEPLRVSPDPNVLAWLEAHQSELALTVITAAELRYGVARLPDGKRRNDLNAAVERLIAAAGKRLLNFDEPASAHYAQLRSTRESKGLHISVEDTMIAAICLSARAEIATRNTKDFVDAGLAMDNPWRG